MLNKIVRMRIKFLGKDHIATGEVMFTVGLIHLFLGENAEAKELISTAKTIYTASLVGVLSTCRYVLTVHDMKGESNPSTEDVAQVLSQIPE